MCGIVGLHILTKCNINIDNNYIFSILTVLFKNSVNLFALITGFLYCKKEIHYKNIIKIVFIVLFYCILFTILFRLIKPSIFSDKMVYFNSLFPIFSGRYWYPVSYVMLFFMIPFLNIMINHLNKKDLELLIKIIFIFLCVITTFGFYDFFKIYNGYSPFWLMYVYILGGYIKLYDFPKKIKRRSLCVLFCMNILIIWLSIIVIRYLTTRLIGHSIFENVLVQYNSPFVLMNSLIVFALLYKIKLENSLLKNSLEKIGYYAFEVYIIHAHFLVITNILPNISKKMILIDNFLISLICLFIEIILIYLSCIMLGFIRSKIFSFFYIDSLIDKVGNHLDNFLSISN